jgi:hypothetical protein
MEGLGVSLSNRSFEDNERDIFIASSVRKWKPLPRDLGMLSAA